MSKARLLWVNGKLLPVGEAVLDPLDRGFTLGDGLFETMRVKGGTVLRLERHASVWHLVSTVCGELRPGLDAVDLLKACFPGGSVTGCPKIRAMRSSRSSSRSGGVSTAVLSAT